MRALTGLAALVLASSLPWSAPRAPATLSAVPPPPIDGHRASPGLSEEGAMTFTLTSPDFTAGGPIPKRFTCEGDDVSPALAWSGVPAAAKSVVLIVDDPDAPDPKAPKMTWVHWVLYDMPPATTGLPAAVSPSALPAGTREGVNDWKRTGYGGPCPPVGRHRYFFKLFALDTVLGDLHRPTRAQVEQAMAGHVVARAELVGTYQKGR
jgi:Raf kinase inhibitor-like YbhB/YbcL family protein